MPRQKKHRHCRHLDGERIFKPRSLPLSEIKMVILELDEFEAIRLLDYEGLDQIQAGQKMGISRGTIQRLVKSGRKKILSALIHNQAIQIKEMANPKDWEE